MRQKIKIGLIGAIGCSILLGLSFFLLKKDAWTFLTWWLLAGVMGMVAMPVTGSLFCKFEDKGWMFSKVLAIAVTGFLTWFLVSVKIIPFTSYTCIGVSLACAAGCIILFEKQQKRGQECFPIQNLKLVLFEECLFFLVFLMWTYLAGFRPEAYGTEKFMDYGFMEAMMRSTKLPATDIWYSQSPINYYYGGQYFAVFLTKLSGSKVELTYNLMRTFVAAFAFMLPFSLVCQMVKDRLLKGNSGTAKRLSVLAGLTAGCAVSLAGNMHYVIYRVILPWIAKFTGKEIESYWFPDSTRYIGHNPDVPDKTIHEFPCYSFILGDLHAHVVNIMFVLLVTGLLYAWCKKMCSQTHLLDLKKSKLLKKELLSSHILLISVLLGMFQWSNFWDFVIYFVVTGGVILFVNIITLQGKWKYILIITAAQAVEILLISYLVILPFTLQFHTMVQGVALAQNHSRIYQLLILWGLPMILSVSLITEILYEKRKWMKNGLARFLASFALPDLFAVITGLCAMGLVLIPELVYVRDIYENGYARANTMFKLTYQAYILFGVTMGYAIFRLLVLKKRMVTRVLAGVGLFLLVCTMGYFGNAVNSWCGNVMDRDNYRGLNALTFLEKDFPEDAAAIRWLKANIKDCQVVLEANGDSYTGYERVSATTGLPTILGWRVHEWLWRNDTADLDVKDAEITAIYTSSSAEEVRNLLYAYDVAYIFVGSCEREKYGDLLNDEILKSMGTVVFQDAQFDTYIVKVEGK